MTRATPIPLRPDPVAWRAAGAALVIRTATAKVFAFRDKRQIEDIVAEHYPQQAADIDLLLRAAVSPTTMVSAPALVQTAVSDFVFSLAPMAAAARLFERALQVSFGRNGEVTLPAIAVPAAAFTAEGAPIRVVRGQTSGAKLTPHAFKSIATLSREMATDNAETIIGQALRESVAVSLDTALFSSNAATPEAPAGLLNGIAPLTPSGPGNRLDAIAADLGNLAEVVGAVSTDIVFVMSPAQAISSTIPANNLPYAVLPSKGIPSKTVVAIAINALGVALDPAPRIQAGMHGSLHEEDANPEPIVDGTPANPVRSLWQADAFALRLVMECCWGLRASGVVAWMTGVNW